MKKTSLTFILLATQTLIFGQIYNTTIGIKLSPGMATYYNLMFNRSEAFRFSTTAGIEIKQRIFKDKLYIESGLNFFDRGSKAKIQISDQNGNDLGISKSSEFDYYLTLPISLIFMYKGFFFGTGPNINYYLTRRFVVDGKLISTGRTNWQENFIYGAQFFSGYELKLPKRFLISFNGFVNPTFKVHYINYGLDIGLKYTLSKQKENE